MQRYFFPLPLWEKEGPAPWAREGEGAGAAVDDHRRYTHIATRRLSARSALGVPEARLHLLRRAGGAFGIFPRRVRGAAVLGRRSHLCRHRRALPALAGAGEQPDGNLA